jgi:hypothetical protein
MALKSRRLLAAVVLAILAALLLAFPASSQSDREATSSEPANTEGTGSEATSVAPAQDNGDETPLASLRARLTGEAEVPGPGDPNGSGRATVAVFSEEVCYRLRFELGTPPATAAHIHVGLPDEAGPIFVLLFNEPEENGSSGCVEVTRAASLFLSEHPGRFYVNVHNNEFPDGAIRGQLRERR